MNIKDLRRYKWYVDDCDRLVVYLGVYEDKLSKNHRYLISSKALYDYYLTRKDATHRASCFVTDSGIVVFGMSYIPPRHEHFNRRLLAIDERGFTAFLSGSIYDDPHIYVINKGGAHIVGT